MPHLDPLVTIIARLYGITPEMLFTSRLSLYTEARMLAIEIADYTTRYSNHDLGEYFSRNHSTINHAITRVRCLLTSEPQLAHTRETAMRAWLAQADCFAVMKPDVFTGPEEERRTA